MKTLTRSSATGVEDDSLPTKVLQFGTGSFLRAFFDWMIHEMNSRSLFEGKISLVQSTNGNTLDKLQDQDFLYTVILRGIEKGEVKVEKTVVDVIDNAVSASNDFNSFLKEADNPHLRFVVSNTTEAGLVLKTEDAPSDTPPSSFPAKLLLILRRRYEVFSGARDRGLLIFPCELIEDNGKVLRDILVELSKNWYPEDDVFLRWLTEANIYFNTLVDRIVSGFPKGEEDAIFNELGYRDALLNTGELYHFLAIEGPQEFQKELPLISAGFNVKWCDDISPYPLRKVRILNGGHTMMVLAAHLLGHTTVKDCMDDSQVKNFLRKGLFEEVLPTMDLPVTELEDFAEAVIERFSNPYLKHFLLSISLNSVSKWKTRILPTLEDYVERKSSLPQTLSFSLVALVLFYRGEEKTQSGMNGRRACDGQLYPIQDSPDALEWFWDLWQESDVVDVASAQELMKKVLQKADFWGKDLNQIPMFSKTCGEMLFDAMDSGIENVLRKLN